MSAGLTTASSPRTMRPQSQRSSARSPRAGHSGLGGHIELRCDSEIDSIRAAGALVASALEAAKRASSGRQPPTSIAPRTPPSRSLVESPSSSDTAVSSRIILRFRPQHALA